MKTSINSSGDLIIDISDDLKKVKTEMKKTLKAIGETEKALEEFSELAIRAESGAGSLAN